MMTNRLVAMKTIVPGALTSLGLLLIANPCLAVTRHLKVITDTEVSLDPAPMSVNGPFQFISDCDASRTACSSRSSRYCFLERMTFATVINSPYRTLLLTSLHREHAVLCAAQAAILQSGIR
jgi:hypothetical protein